MIIFENVKVYVYMSHRTSQQERSLILHNMIKNNEFDKLKNQMELVFARKIANKVQKKEESIIASLKYKAIRKD